MPRCHDEDGKRMSRRSHDDDDDDGDDDNDDDDEGVGGRLPALDYRVER